MLHVTKSITWAEFKIGKSRWQVLKSFSSFRLSRSSLNTCGNHGYPDCPSVNIHTAFFSSPKCSTYSFCNHIYKSHSRRSWSRPVSSSDLRFTFSADTIGLWFVMVSTTTRLIPLMTISLCFEAPSLRVF